MKTAEDEKALRYLLDKVNAPEFTDAFDDCNIAWNVIASIMESYKKETYQFKCMSCECVIEPNEQLIFCKDCTN